MRYGEFNELPQKNNNRKTRGVDGHCDRDFAPTAMEVFQGNDHLRKPEDVLANQAISGTEDKPALRSTHRAAPPFHVVQELQSMRCECKPCIQLIESDKEVKHIFSITSCVDSCNGALLLGEIANVWKN
ncbi:hypothetical protein CEXT_426481 [Caerostris extrusa]|uniref:Uncharacterized protein n=1 Tax=Caerostris extrusa TaxID=172846 RepID=A0AAV4Y302_CAEEX|nr:hypothetical protein CEXT_426481 [Caerostris extrusa]